MNYSVEALGKADEIRSELVLVALDLLDAYDELVEAARRVLNPITDEEVEAAAEVVFPVGLIDETSFVDVRAALKAFMRKRFEEDVDA